MCLSHDVFPETIGLVCGAAYCYNYDGDPAAVKLQAQIAEHGISNTLRKVSGLNPESRLGEKIIASYRELKERSPKVEAGSRRINEPGKWQGEPS